MRHIFRVASLAGCILLAVSLVTTANADPVADFWSKVTTDNPNLIVGESTIRVAFVTSGTIDGNSDNWGNYDIFGDGAAASGLITEGLVTQWQPLVSTADDTTYPDGADTNPVQDWLNNTGSDDADDWVFNTKGERLATSGGAMLTSDLGGQGIRFDESGDDQVRSKSSLAVWTGTNSDGEPAILSDVNLTNSPYYLTLGSEQNSGDTTFGPLSRIGDANENGTEWLSAAITDRSPTAGGDLTWTGSGDGPTVEGTEIERSIYVMSGEVTVVPEPSTVLLWLGCSGLAGLIYWRKRRRS